MSELKLTGEVRDLPCVECGALMRCKWSKRYSRWFYGCTKWPGCQHTFDADQKTGAPLPGQDGRPGHYEWAEGHPEEFTRKPPVVSHLHSTRAFWRHVLDDSYLSEPLEVMPEAFPDNIPIQSPKWSAGRRRRE